MVWAAPWWRIWSTLCFGRFGSRGKVGADSCWNTDQLYKSTPDLTVVSKSPLSVVVNWSTHGAIIFSLAKGMLSINVCIGVFP